MKKFLSLVLALVMTMSLVTISAGATEYKDFTDKGEIKYEEAVTVLNKLGIITGYSEGDFRPEGELTRGAAAKILVSLLIGPDAANALGNESSPYPDVPAGNTFAGVISYCKTAKIINGYGDGTFRPQGTLTGYAFAKMLLGALGYKSEYEGFTGAGWNMNVAKLGGEAGLFDRISFNGNATVTREQACQLALNTLKGTMVEYSGGMNITNGGQSIVVNPDRSYKTSNQEFAQHINNRKAGDQQLSGETWYTVEFGEEHFVDLRMEREQSNADSFGRPSNVWSWKKVTIGTFPIEPDYVFTTQLTHKDATDAAKNRATGLGGFKLENTNTSVLPQTDTRVWVNGKTDYVNNSSDVIPTLTKVAQIADLTDNGTVVEVYVSDLVADFITDIVVVKTQLMEVRRVGSDYVAIQKEDNKDVDKMVANAEAFNQNPIDVTVENILAEDDLYSVVSGLKAGDLVAVVPVAQDETGNTKWDVGDVYVPETVTGALTAVDTYGKSGQGAGSKQGAVSVTVGGTKYNVALWSRDMYDIDPDAVKVTRKDVTLVLDRNGNAMKAKDVGETSDWFIIGSYYSTMVNGKIVTMADGWDASGNKMTLNLGSSFNSATTQFRPGDLVRYGNSTANNADWALSGAQVSNINSKPGEDGKGTYEIKSSDVFIPLVDITGGDLYVDKSIKFIYVNFDEESGDVDSIEIKTGVQGTKPEEIDAFYSKNATTPDTRYNPAQAGFNYKSGTTTPDVIKVVVIKEESNDAMASNMMYIRAQIGGGVKDADGNMIYHYTAAKLTSDGLDEEIDIYTDDQVRVDTFVAYTEREHENYSNFYDLRNHNNFTTRTTSTFQAELGSVINGNNGLIRLAPGSSTFVLGTQGTVDASWNGTATPQVFGDPRNNTSAADDENGGESRNVRIRNAEFLDLRTTAQITATREINSLDDFNWVFEHYLDTALVNGSRDNYLKTGEQTLVMQLIVNDNSSSNSFRDVAMVVITNQVSVSHEDSAPRSSNTGLTSVVLDPVANTGLNKTLNTASANVLTTTQATGTNTKKIVFTLADADATLAVVTAGDDATTTTGTLGAKTDGKYEYTLGADIADGNKLTVEVTAANTTSKRTYSYDFTVDAGATGFTSSVVKKALDTGNDLTQDLTALLSGNTLTGLKVLDTGKDVDITTQVKEAFEKLGYSNVKVSKDSATQWSGTADDANGVSKVITADSLDRDIVSIKVGNTEMYVDTGSKDNLDDLSTELPLGNIRETKVDNTVADHAGTTASLTSAAINAGSTYVDAAFVTFSTANVGTAGTVTGFTVAYTDADGEAVANNAVLEIGDTVTITLKATGGNKTADSTKANAAKITFSDITTAVTLGASNTAGTVASNTAGVVTFTNAGSEVIIKDNDTFAATYTVVKATSAGELALDPTVTYAAAQG